jgi:hypothetical protein
MARQWKRIALIASADCRKVAIAICCANGIQFEWREKKVLSINVASFQLGAKAASNYPQPNYNPPSIRP